MDDREFVRQRKGEGWVCPNSDKGVVGFPSLNLRADSHTSSPLGQMGKLRARARRNPASHWWAKHRLLAQDSPALGASSCFAHSPGAHTRSPSKALGLGFRVILELSLAASQIESWGQGHGPALPQTRFKVVLVSDPRRTAIFFIPEQPGPADFQPRFLPPPTSLLTLQPSFLMVELRALASLWGR